MSETVILSKASARPRRSSREPTASPVGGAICDVADTGRLDKASGKGKPSSLVTVKELVHRDNSRLVQDLMALLAIREATKEATASPPIDGGTADEERQELPLRNRPGDTTTVYGDAAVQSDGTKGAPGAVASLLHRKATAEFASLAGEIIAIADDTAPESNGAKNPVHEGGKIGATNTTTKPDGTMMLHADAAATEPNTNEIPTGGGRLVRAKTKRTEHGKKSKLPDGTEKPPKISKKEARNRDPSATLQPPYPIECFSFGPVPVAPRTGASVRGTDRSATPVPTIVPLVHTDDTLASVGPQRPATLTLEQKLDKLLESVVKIKADMHRRIDRLGRRVEQIHLDVQLNIDNTDRALLRNDLLLIGIPCRERENLQQCFRDVCRVLEYAEADIPQVDIRRQRIASGNRRTATGGPRTGGGAGAAAAAAAAADRAGSEPVPPAPIVVEFMFKTLRDQFYRAYQAKRVLKLSDIGIASDRRFFVNEVLTKYNQKLMAEAVRRKRVGLLHSVYTVDGIVYVQRVVGEKGTKVTSFSSMN